MPIKNPTVYEGRVIIKDLRNKLGFSQSTFAELVRTTRSYIAEIELGKKNPPLPFLERVADFADALLHIKFLIDEKLKKVKRSAKKENNNESNKTVNDVMRRLYNITYKKMR